MGAPVTLFDGTLAPVAAAADGLLADGMEVVNRRLCKVLQLLHEAPQVARWREPHLLMGYMAQRSATIDRPRKVKEVAWLDVQHRRHCVKQFIRGWMQRATVLDATDLRVEFTHLISELAQRRESSLFAQLDDATPDVIA